MRVPWTARRWNQSILKEMNPEYSLEKLMLKLKLQYFDRLMERKDPDAGKDWGREEKEATEDEMVGWHHGLNGWESEQTQGNSEGQGSLACRGPWGRKESDLTWLSDWTTTIMLITGASSMLSKHILTWGWSGASVKLGFEMGKEEWNRKYIRGGVGCGLGASGRRHSSLKYSEQKGRRYTWKLLVSWV